MIEDGYPVASIAYVVDDYVDFLLLLHWGEL